MTLAVARSNVASRLGSPTAALAAVLAAVTSGGCFNPTDPRVDSMTAGDEGTTTTSASGPSTTTATSTTQTTSATLDSSSTTAPSTTDDTVTATGTETGADESSTGEISDCPGGDPTPGVAPYVLTIVIAADDTDDVDVGDINGDGHLDVVNLSRLSTSVETLFGDGTGGFAGGPVTVLGNNGFPDVVRLGAIADDTLDLFVHMEGPVELWVVRGDGAGNWPNPQVYTGTYVRAIDIADLNGDDVLDLAYVGASNLEVRIGLPAETYLAPTLYGENFGSVVRAADLTGDGDLDILTAGYGDNELQIYAGSGDGSFQSEPTLVTGSPISGIDVGRFDGDDLLDLVLTTEQDLRVFYGEAGGGISSTPGTIIPGALGRVRVADIDADGFDDLVTHTSDTIAIRFSLGDASFSPPTDFQCGSFVSSVDVGDFNEDCVPDLVAPQGPGQDLCLLLSDRD